MAKTRLPDLRRLWRRVWLGPPRCVCCAALISCIVLWRALFARQSSSTYPEFRIKSDGDGDAAPMQHVLHRRGEAQSRTHRIGADGGDDVAQGQRRLRGAHAHRHRHRQRHSLSGCAGIADGDRACHCRQVSAALNGLSVVLALLVV